MQPWIALLDTIERGVDACERRYIAGETVEIPPSCALPTDIGPLPPELEVRARSVLARLREIESKISRIPRPGAQARTPRFGAPDRATTATFDHKL